MTPKRLKTLPHPPKMPTREEIERINEAFPDKSSREAALKRIENGEPTAYVTGEQTFYAESYLVGPGTLIPRFDTERLVDALLARVKTLDSPSVLELCTGSGCISISSAAHWKDKSGKVCPDGHITACDISPDALAYAQKNILRNGVSSKIRLESCDVTDKAQIDRMCGVSRYQIIAANPPYIKKSDLAALDESVIAYEPKSALDGGEDGMDFYRAILENFEPYLDDGGAFIFEIGYDQRSDIEKLGQSQSYAVKVTRDYGGNDRVAELTKLR